jgi:hypothetical protein
MSLVAIVAAARDEGVVILGRLRVRDGRFVAEPSLDAPGIRLILGRPAVIRGETSVPPEPTEAFLRILPEAYMGGRFWVEVEEE